MTLTYSQVEKFYNSFGAKQDRQIYEDSARDLLVEQSEFDRAHYIVEFGCGTGKFAARLLAEQTQKDCQYLGVDISEVMIEHCRSNLQKYSPRALGYKSEVLVATSRS